MSYGFMPYRVDIKSLDESLGLVPAHEIDFLVRHNRERIDELRSSFDQSPVTALRSFEKGAVDKKISGSLYWYVYELLVMNSGYAMGNSHWFPAASDDLPTSSLVPHSIDHDFLPLPDDFPAVYVCKREDLDAWQAEADQKVKDIGQLKELKRWVAVAKNEKQDILIFNY